MNGEARQKSSNCVAISVLWHCGTEWSGIGGKMIYQRRVNKELQLVNKNE